MVVLFMQEMNYSYANNHNPSWLDFKYFLIICIIWVEILFKTRAFIVFSFDSSKSF